MEASPTADRCTWACGAATLTGAFALAAAAVVPAPGNVAFVRSQGDRNDNTITKVFVAGSNGSRPRSLTAVEGVLQFSVSPDRRWIGYSSQGVLVGSTGGGRVRLLSKGASGLFIKGVTWSRDSRLLAFAVQGEIWISSPLGPPRVFGLGNVAAWSPARARGLAYATDDHVYLATIGGGERVVARLQGVESLAFSPDGTRLVATVAEPSNSEIYVLDLATGERRNLSRSPRADVEPAWSPDGRVVSWSRRAAVSPFADEPLRSGDGIWLANADGTARRRLTSAPRSSDHPRTWTPDLTPTWSPDGRSLLFVRSCRIYRVRASGGRPQWFLTQQPRGGEGCDEYPIWLR